MVTFERRGGLVRDQQRLGRHESARAIITLAHAAGELERVVVDPPRGPAGCRPSRAARSPARGPAPRGASCSWICSMIWSPIFGDRVQEVVGSWKIIAISAPRSRLSSSSRRDQLRALVVAPCPRSARSASASSPISVIAVTDLPEPDSPTTASTSPGCSSSDTPSTACTTPFGGERQLQFLDRESRVAACTGAELTADGSAGRGTRT